MLVFLDWSLETGSAVALGMGTRMAGQLGQGSGCLFLFMYPLPPPPNPHKGLQLLWRIRGNPNLTNSINCRPHSKEEASDSK